MLQAEWTVKGKAVIVVILILSTWCLHELIQGYSHKSSPLNICQNCSATLIIKVSNVPTNTN